MFDIISGLRNDVLFVFKVIACVMCMTSICFYNPVMPVLIQNSIFKHHYIKVGSLCPSSKMVFIKQN